ncbi:MAG TPA: hypothetical protein VJ731_01280 [Terriglobales bacterium]|nr:hypothetical protein [Terriglobales bacterium]
MDAKLRIITHLPLAQLWRDDGFATEERGRSLTCEDVRQLLKSGPVQFVVADVGVAPRWIPERECFDFWKDEVQPHLASDGVGGRDQFPGAYRYFAVQWHSRKQEGHIVVLEKQH